MSIKGSYRFIFFSLFCSILGYAPLAQSAENITEQTKFSLEQPSVAASYQTAAIQFLPNYKDSDIGYNTHDLTAGSIADDDSCSAYPLSSCPANGNCRQCPTNRNKYRLLSCQDPYIITSNKTACRAKVCSDFGAGYKSAPGANEVCYKQSFASTTKLNCYFDCEKKVTCSTVASGGQETIPSGKKCTSQSFKYSDLQTLQCYVGCRSLNCSGYNLNCLSKPAHATSMTKCPDCSTSLERYLKPGTITSSIYAPFIAQCDSSYCKIGACEDGYKISSDGTKCLNDTCSKGYYKECETGTQGTAQYTETGTACYQCKPASTSCSEKGYYDSTYWNSKKPSDGQTYSFVKTATCPYASNYYMGYWNPTTCNAPNPGYYLYSDLTCSSQLISGKTVIGVIFSDLSITNSKLALALTGYNVKWSDTSVDIPNLKNSSSVIDDTNGKANSYIISSYCNVASLNCPAATNATSYKTAGTSAGDWYLPAGTEMEMISINKSLLDSKLSAAGGRTLGRLYLWTSTEASASTAYTWHYSAGWKASSKTSSYHARPIIDLARKTPTCSQVSCSNTLTSCPANGVCSVCVAQTSTCTQAAAKYMLTGCNAGYVKSGNTCVAPAQKCTNPQVGYILYSDKSCSSTLTSGKTPIAVIADTTNKVAVALENKGPTKWYDYGSDELINTHLAGLTGDGKTDTATLLKNCGPCTAVITVNSYTPAGTSRGDWYLPSKSELDVIYNKRSTINSGISKAGGTQISTSTTTWSSSRSGYDIIWATGASSYELDMRESHYVRPVMNYQDWLNK